MLIESGGLRASIVIPTYNRGELLLLTVGHFLGQLSENDELVVVDQSDKPSLSLQNTSAPKGLFRYLHIEEKGLPNARNVGVENSSGAIVIFCDDDVIPENGFLSAHVNAYEDPNIGAVAGRIILDGIPATRDGSFGTIRRTDFKIVSKFNSLERKFADHFQGCNFSASRKVFMQGVRSDKRFAGTAHLEECDLALQITEKKYKILFEPDAALLHLVQPGGGCRMPDMGRWLYWYGHNYMLLHLKHGPRFYFPIFLLARLVKLSLSAASSKNPDLLINGVRGLIDGGKTYFAENGVIKNSLQQKTAKKLDLKKYDSQ